MNTPTPRLRFVMRGAHTPSLQEVTEYAARYGYPFPMAIDKLTKPGQRILQQWFSHDEHSDEGEWHDVPLEKEE